MDSRTSELATRTPLRETASNGLKIVVVGGFGVGKTTMVRSVSEIRPLNTEETMTQAGVGVDEGGGHGKSTTTVAFDFGRITLNEEMVLYLFGAPGQRRFTQVGDGENTGAQAVIDVMVGVGDVVGQRRQLRLDPRPGGNVQRPARVETFNRASQFLAAAQARLPLMRSIGGGGGCSTQPACGRGVRKPEGVIN